MDHAERLYGNANNNQESSANPFLIVSPTQKKRKKAPMTLEERVEKLYGMKSDTKRATFIPVPTGALRGQTGPIDWTDWTAPQFVYDLAKTAVLPGHTLEGGSFTHRDTVEAAMNLTGGGFTAGSALLSKVGSGGSTILGMSGGRIPLYKRSTSSVKEFATEIDKVLKTKNSSNGKVFREDLGEISIDFGFIGIPTKKYTKAWGLSHIVDKRTRVDGINGLEFVRKKLPRILSEGRLVKIEGDANGRRATLETKGETVHLGLMKHDKKEVWILTGYERYT